MIDHEEFHFMASLYRIRQKLDRLREADRGFSVFGAHSHGYRLGPPLSESALAQCEKRLGVQLPTEYRLFVTRLGHGGAGPYYGLFSLEDRDSEDITDLDQIRKPFRWSEAFNPYDWEDPCSKEDIWCSEDVDEEQQPQVILNVPGALYICHYGCAIRFFLIVNGQGVGEVWRDSQGDDAGVMPECGDDDRHLGFFDWYEKWLDEASAADSSPPA
ncbi:MAG TPA: SMI1/KNR4 family protein [Bryobacteraceae bacterium]|jgi:SMI1/KNR4 family protein SUKH-1|nr:SMI1/KNR4 family protein [Bryobacteraceae bacterium]